MRYVDGFVIPVPKKNVKAYLKMARWGKKTWRKHGAIDYKECIGDDLSVDCGMPFQKLCKLKPSETVVFAFITYKNRAHRNKVNKAVMKEMEKMPMPKMPFDMKRMTYGGFTANVDI